MIALLHPDFFFCQKKASKIFRVSGYCLVLA